MADKIWTTSVKRWNDGTVSGVVENGYRFFSFERHPGDTRTTIHGVAPETVKRRVRELVKKSA